MPVTVICPNLNCRATVVAQDSARGRVVRCAHCRQPFRVPLARVTAEDASADGTPPPTPPAKGKR